MSRSISTDTKTNLAQAHVTAFPLVDMEFTGDTLYCCGAPFDVSWGGNTYLGVQGLGQIDVLSETDAEIKGLTFTLSGIPLSNIAMALETNVANCPVTVRLATVDAAGVLSVDTNVWQGYLDTLGLVDNGESATVQVTAEHRMVSWKRPTIKRFTSADQAEVDADDAFFSYVEATTNATIVWPNKEFFKV